MSTFTFIAWLATSATALPFGLWLYWLRRGGRS